MNISNSKPRSFIKKFFFYIVYFFTGVVACFFAFILVVNFLNPAVSEEPAEAPKEEKLTAKKVFVDIFKNLKQIINESFPAKEQKPVSLEVTPQPVEQNQALEENVDTPPESPPKTTEENAEAPESPPQISEGNVDSSKDSPEPPENFEGEAYGNTVQPSNQVTSQPVDMEASEASVEVQSYMAPFIYESIQQKDPFEDPTIDKTEGVVIVPKTPPEEYDLSKIKIKGVSWNEEKPELSKALFELPDDAGHYTLREGDRIGKGVIFKIREGEVFIVETNYIGSGENRKEERTIKIKKMDRLGLKEI